MKRSLLVLAGLVLVGVQVAAQNVSIDFDADYDLSSKKTFIWGEGVTAPGNELAQKRLEAAIKEALAGAGLQLVSEGDADLVVVYHAVVDQETKKKAVNLGVGVSRRVSKKGAIRVGASTSPKPKTIEVGTLVIDVRDGETGDLVWTATATDTLKADSEAREAQVRKALDAAFSDFPPKS